MWMRKVEIYIDIHWFIQKLSLGNVYASCLGTGLHGKQDRGDCCSRGLSVKGGSHVKEKYGNIRQW